MIDYIENNVEMLRVDMYMLLKNVCFSSKKQSVSSIYYYRCYVMYIYCSVRVSIQRDRKYNVLFDKRGYNCQKIEQV